MENRGISLMIRGVNDDFSFDKKNEMDIKMKKSGNGKNLSGNTSNLCLEVRKVKNGN